jgi:glycogen synthase
MNILILCDEYPPCRNGGIGTVTQLLARTLIVKGHNVCVVGFYPYYREAEKEETDQGVKVFRYFYGSNLGLKLSKHKFFGKFFNIKDQFEDYIKFLRRVIEKNCIEIIETPDFVEAFRYSGPQIIRFPDFGIPIVVKLHGTYTYFNHLENIHSDSITIYDKEKLHLENATEIIAVSNFVMTETKSLFNYSKNAQVIYNGIVTDNSEVYNANQSEYIVIFAGTLAEKKGIFSLIKAWGKVINTIPTASLFIYGKGSNSTIDLINKIITSIPNNSIFLKGFVSNGILANSYGSAACAIFPSYAEAFSMAPMEAMAIGCPVIFTKRTSGPELIKNGVDGLLVDPDNINEISESIIYMLKNRKEAMLMGTNARSKIRKYFDINTIADKHIKVYSGIINKTSHFHT